MNAAVYHNVGSLKIHELVFRGMAKSFGNTPSTRDLCNKFADEYQNLARQTDSQETGVVIKSFSALENMAVVEDIERDTIDWREYQDQGNLIWEVCLVNPEMLPIPGTRHVSYTAWDFYQKMKAYYPDAPRGIHAWAAVAMPGEAAAFVQNTPNRIFHISIRKEVRKNA